MNPMTEGDLIALIERECGPVQRTSEMQWAVEVARVAMAAERERCAKLCEGAREAASHSSDGLKRAGAMAMAASCAKLIRA